MARAERDMYVIRLAASIKQTYMEERRQFYLKQHGDDMNYMPRRDKIAEWDGGRDGRGAVHKSAWEGIAQFATKNNVSPIELIRAAFEMWTGNSPPLPNQIKSQQALADLKYRQENNVGELKQRFSMYADEATLKFLLWKKARNLPDEQAWLEVIASSELQFSARFRFILASGLRLAQSAEFWRKPAMQEYIRAPNLYNEVLGDKIPSDFREESDRICAVLSRNS